DIQLAPSKAWLEAHPGRPLFVTYLTVTPHIPYYAPGRYGTLRFSEDDAYNRYLNSVRYEDFFLRELIAQYATLGLYEDTVFIVLGDHGEGFGEHGRFTHDDVP